MTEVSAARRFAKMNREEHAREFNVSRRSHFSVSFRSVVTTVPRGRGMRPLIETV
jgi:hypothetical protein